jgi:hypothetical protein
MYIGLYVKYPLFLSAFNETPIFSADLRKFLKCQISWKSVLWEPSCYMRTDRQAWRSQQSLLVILRTRLKTNAPAHFSSQVLVTKNTAVRHTEAPKSQRHAGDKRVAWYVPPIRRFPGTINSLASIRRFPVTCRQVRCLTGKERN